MKEPTTGWLRSAILTTVTLLNAAAANGGSLDVNNTAACEGNFGLEVTAGSPCLFDTESTVSGGTVSGTHGACAYLFADTVTTTGTTTFIAGRQIELGNDFAAEDGFTADLNGVINPLAVVIDDSPAGEITYRASFQLNLDNLTLDGTDQIRHLLGIGPHGGRWFEVLLQPSVFPAGESRLRLQALQDDGSTVSTPFGEELLFPSGCATVEIDWVAAPGAGRLLMSLNGGGFVGLTGLSNAAGRVERVEWGAAGGALQGIVGSLYLDDFASSR